MRLSDAEIDACVESMRRVYNNRLINIREITNPNLLQFHKDKCADTFNNFLYDIEYYKMMQNWKIGSYGYN